MFHPTYLYISDLSPFLQTARSFWPPWAPPLWHRALWVARPSWHSWDRSWSHRVWRATWAQRRWATTAGCWDEKCWFYGEKKETGRNMKRPRIEVGTLGFGIKWWDVTGRIGIAGQMMNPYKPFLSLFQLCLLLLSRVLPTCKHGSLVCVQHVCRWYNFGPQEWLILGRPKLQDHPVIRRSIY